MDTAVVPELQRQPDAASAIRASVQPRELPAVVGVAFGREALVADDASGQADEDRGEDRSACPVRHVSDGRGGHFTTAVQGHPSPDYTTRATSNSADMTKTAFAGMETTRNPRGRSARIRTNSAEGHLRWLLLGCERPQEQL